MFRIGVLVLFAGLLSGCENCVTENVAGQAFCIPKEYAKRSWGWPGDLWVWTATRGMQDDDEFSFKISIHLIELGGPSIRIMLAQNRADIDYVLTGIVGKPDRYRGLLSSKPGDRSWKVLTSLDTIHQRVAGTRYYSAHSSKDFGEEFSWIWEPENFIDKGAPNFAEGGTIKARCKLPPDPVPEHYNSAFDCERAVKLSSVSIMYSFSEAMLQNLDLLDKFVTEQVDSWMVLQ